MKKWVVITAVMGMFFVIFLCGQAQAQNNQMLKNLDLRQAKVADYNGLIEIKRDGQLVRLRKGTQVYENDLITVYQGSYLEICFRRDKDIIIRLEEKCNFILKQLLDTSPYGFEVRYEPKSKNTTIVLIFKPETWYIQFASLLREGNTLYTAVFVREGVVSVEDKDETKEELINAGYMTYVFRNKPPSPPLSWEEFAAELCVENCWGEE